MLVTERKERSTPSMTWRLFMGTFGFQVGRRQDELTEVKLLRGKYSRRVFLQSALGSSVGYSVGQLIDNFI